MHALRPNVGHILAAGALGVAVAWLSGFQFERKQGQRNQLTLVLPGNVVVHVPTNPVMPLRKLLACLPWWRRRRAAEDKNVAESKREPLRQEHLEAHAAVPSGDSAPFRTTSNKRSVAKQADPAHTAAALPSQPGSARQAAAEGGDAQTSDLARASAVSNGSAASTDSQQPLTGRSRRSVTFQEPVVTPKPQQQQEQARLATAATPATPASPGSSKRHGAAVLYLLDKFWGGDSPETDATPAAKQQQQQAPTAVATPVSARKAATVASAAASATPVPAAMPAAKTPLTAAKTPLAAVATPTDQGVAAAAGSQAANADTIMAGMYTRTPAATVDGVGGVSGHHRFVLEGSDTTPQVVGMANPLTACKESKAVSIHETPFERRVDRLVAQEQSLRESIQRRAARA